MKSLLIPPFWALLLIAGTSQAEIIASTTFDGRIADGHTATNLTWVTNGVADPGDLSANRFEGNSINLFDGTPDVQNRFVPGINTGNGNTSWVTTVALTPLPGSEVTVENVTLDYIAINGGQVLNVRRRSDFEVTLLDPSGNPLASGNVAEAVSGNGLDPEIAPVLITLDSPVTLSGSGSYSLIVRGGDFLQDDETGNHTGIDNLSINGSIGGSSGGPSVTAISITPGTGELELVWRSTPETSYTVSYSSDLVDWSLSLDEEVVAGPGETTTFQFNLSTLPGGIPEQLFFQVERNEIGEAP